MTLVILFVFGAIIGSFLNVLSLRWPKPDEEGTKLSLSIFAGRSSCPSCGNKLQWFELVPIFSFVFLAGKCRSCGIKISWQYPLVELVTGLVFASLFITISPSDILSTIYYLISTIIFCIYIVIFVYDAWYKIIPNQLVYSAILLALVYRVSTHFLVPSTSNLDLLAGVIIFSFFGLIWLLSKGRAMGFGDAKLGLSIGLLLGAASGFSAIILAFWTGALVALSLMMLGKLGFLNKAKGLTMKSELPFAPFIILGAWLAFVFSLDILHVALF